MYAKHCHFVLEGSGETLHHQKLHHLPPVDSNVELTPLSTGVMTRYKVESVELILEEVTTTYPPPPGGSSVSWENKWVINVSEVP